MTPTAGASPLGLARIAAWVRASRLPSQSYIALPLLLGQLVAERTTGELDLAILALVQAFGVFDQLAIVYGNDWADVETDRRNETATMFSGGSRVLVDGLLSRRSVGRAAILAAVLALASTAAITVVWGRLWTLPLGALGLALLWAYSFPPLRLSYRGGGEWLQMAGVGGVLPLLGYSAQTGSLAGFPWLLLAVLLPTHLACAVATSLPDEPSDAASDKRTFAVRRGPVAAKVAILLLQLASVVSLAGLVALLGADPTDRASALRPLATHAGWLFPVPLVAIGAAALTMCGSAPGSRRLAAHVFFVVLATIGLVGALIGALATG